MKIKLKNFNLFHFFGLKEKEKIQYRILTFYNVMIDMLSSMFEYSFNEEENPYFDYTVFEKMLIEYGECGLAKTENDGVVVGRFSFSGGELDYNGRLTKGKVICLNGKEFEGIIGKDIIWVWNNNNHEHDRNLQRFACMLADVDLSLVYNVKYSRNCPIPIVKNTKMKASITSVLQSIFDKGEMDVAIDDVTSITELTNGEQKKFDVLNLTDVSTSDKLQNLEMLSDWLMSRLARYYGISLTGNGKKAQQSVDEIRGYSQFSSIVPLIRLKQRRKALDLANKLWGTDFKVDFSTPLKMLSEEVEVITDTDIDNDNKIGTESEENENEVEKDL